MIGSRKYRPLIFFVSIFAALTILNTIQQNPINWIQNFFVAVLVAVVYMVIDSFSKKDKKKNPSIR